MSFILEILNSSLRMANPLIFAAMAALLCERSGVINLALEGFLLLGAWIGAVSAFYFHSPWIGLVLAIFAGFIMAIAFGYLVIEQRLQQIITGIGFNLLISGTIPFLNKISFGSTGSSPALDLDDRFLFFPIVLSLAVVLVMKYVMDYTFAGIIIKFCGEHPESVESAGVSVKKIRWATVLAAGSLTAAGGVSLSVYLSSSYSPLMSGGRGFIALAALIFGRWNVLSTFGACLFFG